VVFERQSFFLSPPEASGLSEEKGDFMGKKPWMSLYISNLIILSLFTKSFWILGFITVLLVKELL
jgi:hypothetical protein